MTSRFRVEESSDIAEVLSGFPVGFCLLTAGNTQYVAYYDRQHRMTVASRTLDSDTWEHQVLPTRVGWDSHNYVTMAVDDDGHLHVSGNMHCVPLIYLRSQKAADIRTMETSCMTGRDEQQCTYPRFMRGADNRLIFHYRDGGSGRGNEIYNVYDLGTTRWIRLLDQPLTDGQQRMNAYMSGPIRGPDGWFHMHWVWRDTPDCATNHHLSYARSRDLLRWESVFGDTVDLPITVGQKSLWVDPIPSGGGIINGGHRLWFDAGHRPVLTYHKSDDNGNMQVYAARPEGGIWKQSVLTNWRRRVTFSGEGSMEFIGIRISELSRATPGILTMTYRHQDYGTGRLVIDEMTLKTLEKQIPIVPEYPQHLDHVQNSFPGMRIQRAQDTGNSGIGSVRYVLQWESLGSNRDRPRKPPLPNPSMLKLYKLSINDEPVCPLT